MLGGGISPCVWGTFPDINTWRYDTRINPGRLLLIKYSRKCSQTIQMAAGQDSFSLGVSLFQSLVTTDNLFPRQLHYAISV